MPNVRPASALALSKVAPIVPEVCVPCVPFTSFVHFDGAVV